VVIENSHASTLLLDVDGWQGHRPGQHVDIRLTAEDGYQAERSYSIASAPEDPRLALTVQRIDDGEVSPWLTQIAAPGDTFELRGPVGGYFIWDGSEPLPPLLVGGGSGVVPLMAMARHRHRRNIPTPMRLLYSVRSPDEILYSAELEQLAKAQDGFEVVYTFTQSAPKGWTGFARRVDNQILAEVVFSQHEDSSAFVCGPTPFVEAVSKVLVRLGYMPGHVKTERFGPTGTRPG
jgi:ferredoxin-NADP reductase